LVARAVEQHLERHGGDVAWQVARVSVELVRPVPVAPLLVTARTTRPGGKVTLVDVTVAAGEAVAARAVALAVRRQPLNLSPIGPVPDRPGPEEVKTEPPGWGTDEWVAFHNSGVELRVAAGRWREPGPAIV
jgi:hypothetical protein